MAEREHNRGMESFQMPSDLEISAAYAQGEAAVVALFHRWYGRLAAQYQALEDRVSGSSQADFDEIDKPFEDPPGPDELARSHNQDADTAAQAGGRRSGIQQGDIYWVSLEAGSGLGPGITHPHVVIQDNVINRSRIHSVAVCGLTSNRNRANIPGNLLLEAGEANLPRQSVVEVSKVAAVDKTQLGEYIGSLSEQRVKQILDGMQFLQLFTEAGEIDE
jgi:mRNA interferase MazF